LIDAVSSTFVALLGAARRGIHIPRLRPSPAAIWSIVGDTPQYGFALGHARLSSTKRTIAPASACLPVKAAAATSADQRSRQLTQHEAARAAGCPGSKCEAPSNITMSTKAAA